VRSDLYDAVHTVSGKQTDKQAMKAKATWILIADGARARVLRNAALDVEVEGKQKDIVFEIERKQLREIMSDRPGRSFAPAGARRSSMEYRSEPEKDQEARFADMLLEQLDRRLRSRQFDRLAIIAEPRMLGVLRQRISPTLRRTIFAEVAKDLTKMPQQALREAIAQLDIR
jgi:protein required for attachment to host cells